jgi:hypothetical protein
MILHGLTPYQRNVTGGANPANDSNRPISTSTASKRAGLRKLAADVPDQEMQQSEYARRYQQIHDYSDNTSKCDNHDLPPSPRTADIELPSATASARATSKRTERTTER